MKAWRRKIVFNCGEFIDDWERGGEKLMLWRAILYDSQKITESNT